MKKILLSIFALAAFGVNAQLAPGSTAPDFTATDVYGNSHSLYADYLNEGKPVLLNISATWCGPCWNYHNTHALGDFYDAYGPNGSNEVMVLYVEGDNSTPVDAIYGQGSTHGDWTIDTPYPIINNGSIANQYQIQYFPTLYRICPNGITTELNQLTAVNLKNNISTNCTALTGVANHAKLYSVSSSYCTETGLIATVSLKNIGNNALTSATVVLKENGSVIETKNYSGNLNQFASANITFNELTLSDTSDYTFEIQSVNGGSPYNTSIGIVDFNPSFAKEVQSTNLEVRIYTDNYPTEIRWRIKNSTGTIVASGGPYQGNTNGGGADANTTKTHNITVSSSDDCYNIELIDQYGDGWTLPSSSQANTPGLEIFENGNSVIFVNGNRMFSTNSPLTKQRAFKYSATSSIENLQLSKFSVYPNPSIGIFNVSTTEVVNVAVVDITGKTVYQANGIDNNSVINLSSLQKGIYLIQVSGETIKTTEKLILN